AARLGGRARKGARGDDAGAPDAEARAGACSSSHEAALVAPPIRARARRAGAAPDSAGRRARAHGWEIAAEASARATAGNGQSGCGRARPGALAAHPGRLAEAFRFTRV